MMRVDASGATVPATDQGVTDSAVRDVTRGDAAQSLDASQPDPGRSDAQTQDTQLADMGVLDATPIPDQGLPTVDAVVSPDQSVIAMDAAQGGMCPPREGRNDCLFGRDSRQLRESQTLHVVQTTVRRGPGDMTDLERRQLLKGFECEGIFTPRTTEAAYDLIDDGGVQIYRIRRVNPSGYYTWLRFYMGDTEVGHLFAEATLDLVARVSDQDIVACHEPLGDAPPMSCAELDACLAACNEADLPCRRPCLRATAPDAVEAYISWGECRSDCGADEACLDRVCDDERTACFGP